MTMSKPLARTAPSLLREMALRSPLNEAWVDRRQRLTYQEALSAARAVARGLRDAGVEAKSRLGILMGNRVEWLSAYFAAMSLGAEVVALNTWLTPRELQYQLEHSGVELLVLEADYLGRDWLADLTAMAEAGAIAGLNKIILVDSFTDGQLCHVSGAAAARFELIEFASLVAEEARKEPAQAPFGDAVQATDVACILYTSGSTALPKGVPLLHGAMLDNMWSIGERMHLTERDRLWLAVSLFWSFACVNAVFTLTTHGGTIVLQHQFKAAQALELIAQERCSVFYGTPNMTRAMLDQPIREQLDLKSLRTGATIGTPRQLQDAYDLGVHQICNVYGLDRSVWQFGRLRCRSAAR